MSSAAEPEAEQPANGTAGSLASTPVPREAAARPAPTPNAPPAIGRRAVPRPAGEGRRVASEAGRMASQASGHLPVKRFPALTVATPRLFVRPLEKGDAAGTVDVFADRLTQRWLPFPPDYGLAEGLAWCTQMAQERRECGAGDHYGVIRREDDRLVGCVWAKRTDWGGMVTELSYAMSPEARGFGLVVEAVDALTVALLLEHGFQRVELRIAPGNVGSRRVAEKAGFTYEGLLRNAGFVHGGRVDLEVWSFVAADLSGARPS